MCILLEYPSIEDYPVYEPPKNCREQIFTVTDNISIDGPKSKCQLNQYHQFGQATSGMNAKTIELEIRQI